MSAVAFAVAVAVLGGCPDEARDDADSAPDTETDATAVETDATAVETDATPATDAPDVELTPDTIGSACEIDLDCRLTCADGRCVAGRCAYAGPDPSATGCAIGGDVSASPAVGDDDPLCVAAGAPSPERACFFCNPDEEVAGWTSSAFGETFEVGAGRLLIEKLTPSSASWTISAARAANGAKSLYFGDAALGGYDVGERAAARAVTPTLVTPDGTELTLAFQVYADTEETPGFDRLRVLLLPPEGDDDEPLVVWTSDQIGGTTLGVFLPIQVTLGAVRSGQRVAFEVDTVDEIINGFEGFYLDDVRVRSRCCDAGHGCDDGNVCTTDSCVEGECSYATRASCCLADVDCDDGDPCSDDRCEPVGVGGSPDVAAGGGACVSTLRLECCAVAKDCDDGDPCTEDQCALADDGGGSCKQVPLCCERTADCEDADSCTIGECLDGQCRYRSACCREDSDCDDRTACTIDTCAAGVCQYELTYDVGCCIPDILTERFDGGTPDGWQLSPPANNIGWRVHGNATAPSGTSVLYYGHPTLNFYESGGRNTGSATSPLVRLPDGVEMRLSFSVLLDIEANPQRDLFRVEALIGQSTIVLADKAEIARGSWQEVVVDLTWAASQAVQIRFVFDTVDQAQNTTRGVLIDDVRLLSTCLPRRCGLSAECGSRAECITGTCEEGICRFGGGC